MGENGSFISGGERQKICFGRFLLRKDYDIFVLDEPFTSLDAITEKNILKIAMKHLSDKTGIVISHKFNVLLSLAKTFIVLENGIISQRGKHEDLICRDGLYKNIFDHYTEQNTFPKNENKKE